MTSISIIIPVFGVEKHIERCLRSVMRQDYTGSIQCIIVNDCTRDRSIEIATEVLAEYHGKISFFILNHETNRGLSAARNTGTAAATGDYIFYLDSDDEIMPHAISTLSSLAEKYPGVDLVYGDWYTAHRYISLQNSSGLPEYTSDKLLIADALLIHGRLAMTAPNKLIRRNFMTDNGLHFLEGVYHEDEYYNYFLAETARSIAVSYVPTYVYYINPHGITGSDSNVSKRQSSLIHICNEVLEKGKTPLRLLFCLRFIRFLTSAIDSQSSNVRPLLELAFRTKSVADKGGFTYFSIYLLLFKYLPYNHLHLLHKKGIFSLPSVIIWRQIFSKYDKSCQ